MKKILVVDDDREICNLVEQILSSKNYYVISVASASEALKQIKSNSFDLILLDMHLPDGNGIDLLPKFMSAQNIPVILMTAFGNWKSHVRSYEFGAYYFLDKPFRINLLRNLVKQALHSY
ncbi:MAG TPA: response regulator, partial [Acidobacteriota bacterium]|nr:response regulator [Acidobacteriota bacterium]